jgi:diguanylate cyclase (GGDEF)-like protein
VALFVVSALLPLLIAMAIVYGRVYEALVEAHEARLGQAVEGYATTLLERLTLAEQLLRTYGGAAPSPAAAGELRRHFQAAALYPPGAPPHTLLASGRMVPDRDALGLQEAFLESGGTQVSLVWGYDGPQIWLVRDLADMGQPDTLLAVRLADAFLWGDVDEMPFATQLCVLDGEQRPLHCTARLPQEAHGRLGKLLVAGPAGSLHWQDAGATQFASFREVFLQPRFRGGSWPIVVWQADTDALAPIERLRAVVLPIIAIALLGAALLGLTQVRRTMDPLQHLIGAVARVGKRDFTTRVEIPGDDEFRELAVAFNGMSERLGRQFGALGTLAEIDEVILSRVDLDRIAAVLVARMREVVRGQAWLLLLADAPGAPGYTVRGAQYAGAAAMPAKVVLSVADVAALQAAPDGLVMGRGTSSPILPPLLGVDARHVFALPVIAEGALQGMLVVGGMPDGHPDAEEAALLRGFAHRLAVGVAAAARDRELFRRANFDFLTELPNRPAFLEAFALKLARSRDAGRMSALLFIDLDGFAKVNDSLGHAIGDALLVHAAARLSGLARHGDLVARLGGDEFVLVLADSGDAEEATRMARRAALLLAEPYDLGHGDTYVSASIGIAMYPQDGDNASTLLAHADLAMYEAKKSRSGHACFTESMTREAERRFRLDRELRLALDQEQLVLYYQPQLDLAAGCVVGAEALIRWLHPERGLVPPGEFIGFAEESGLIEEMGAWAVREACRQLVRWREAGLPLAHVSVNVSPRQFRGRDFVEIVAAALHASGLAPSSLRLEITESVLADDGHAAEEILARLHGLGTPLELDDFGTGYSSLSYLQRLPVQTVKLDRSFIRDITESRKARALAQASIDMVHALEKEVVAEGVETLEQAVLLRSWGCEAIQGFLLSRPVPAAQFATAVATAQRAVATPPARDAA